MKNCQETDCPNQIGDNYTLCFEHFKAKKGTEPVTEKKVASQWHNDPIVDQLMKINSNIARIAKALEERPPQKDSDGDKEFFVPVE